MDFYKKFSQTLAATYQGTPLPDDSTIERLFSPHKVIISKKQYDFITQFVSDFFALSRTDTYQSFISQGGKPHRPTNNSVLMAYDFHLSVDGVPKLIEVNTNASGFPYVNALYKHHDMPSEAMELLINSFKKELSFCESDSPYIAIIDEDLKSQKMLSEFYLYKKIFEDLGFKANIFDESELIQNGDNLFSPDNKKIDFVYNRFCDFYFSNPSSQKYKHSFEKGSAVYSPNPWEYYLLADKQRMIELTQTDFLNNKNPALQNGFLKSYDIKNFDSFDDLLQVRKKLFFKPKNSYGSKSTYNGKSVSKKILERFWNEGGMAQESCPAPETHIDEQRWKYDIRAYVYKDQVQQLCARLYQGQLTNFNTKGGGFAPIVVKN